MIEHTERGRWGGRLTRKPLPVEDPSIDKLSAHEREVLAEIWLRRAAMERRVADSFMVIHAALQRRSAARDLVDLAERAIDDEYRHTELSRVVASRFAGRELETPGRLSLEVPKHKGASDEVRDTLFIVGQCVLNETTAGAYLECCYSQAEGSLAKAACGELLSDEIDHGRIGWAHLASVDAATKAEVGRWILPMAFLNLRVWRYETPLDAEHARAYAKHGAPDPRQIHAALRDALSSLIVPGLAQLGVPTAALEKWIADGAGTERPPIGLVDELVA